MATGSGGLVASLAGWDVGEQADEKSHEYVFFIGKQPYLLLNLYSKAVSVSRAEPSLAIAALMALGSVRFASLLITTKANDVEVPMENTPFKHKLFFGSMLESVWAMGKSAVAGLLLGESTQNVLLTEAAFS